MHKTYSPVEQKTFEDVANIDKKVGISMMNPLKLVGFLFDEWCCDAPEEASEQHKAVA